MQKVATTNKQAPSPAATTSVFDGSGPTDQEFIAPKKRQEQSGSDARSTKQGQRYALLVGVQKYDKAGGLRPLSYTANDVTKLAELLYQSGYRPENIVLMTEDRGQVDARFLPEREKVWREIRSLLRDRNAEDSLLLAFAGHGLQFNGEEDNYFCPLNARIEQRETLISMKEVYRELETCKAGVKLLFSDACRNDPFSQSARGLTLVKEEARTSLAPPKGIAALFSCSENEAAYEDPNLKHGVFFHFAIEGLLGDADLDKDAAITLPELELYTKQRVSDYVRSQFRGDRQMPNLKGNTRGLVAVVRLADLEVPRPSLFAELPRGGQGPVIVNSIGMKFVRIEGGDGWMGSSATEGRPTGVARASEPLHLVRITEPFQIGMHEVTQGEYERVMGTNPSGFSNLGAGKEFVDGMDTRRFPVETVSWNNAVTFCRRLSADPQEKEAGRVYRLPTEAEWEYACRGLGKDAPLLKRLARANERSHGLAMNIPEELRNELAFHFGSDDALLDDYDWYKENAEERTHLVESKKPNQFGLYDMLGNVHEWCADWYGHSYFEAHQQNLYPYLRRKLANGLIQPGAKIDPDDALGAFGNGTTALEKIPFQPVLDPTGPSDDDVNRNRGKALYWGRRVVRGGSWMSKYNQCRSDFRGCLPADVADDNIGFRVVMLRSADKKAVAQYAAADKSAPVLLDPTPDEVIAALEKLGRTRQNTSWLKKVRTVEYYQNVDGSKAVVRVFLNGTLVTDAELVHLKGLNNLEILDLSNTTVSDAGLAHLTGLNNLSQLDLTDTNVTAAGAKKLQQALPKCRITLPRPAPEKTPDAATVKKQITPAHLALGDPVVNSVGMPLAPIPAGKFTMGKGSESLRGRGYRGKSVPSHLVTLTKPFYLGVYEVTQEQYERVVGVNPSKYKGAQLPVDNVSWGDAAEFCRKLSALPEEKATGRVYRLPTEAEWEYACRAGTTTEYSFGDETNQLHEYAWYARNSERMAGTRQRPFLLPNSSHPVGQKKPNHWGFYDMHGNVKEWCLDWDAFSRSPTNDLVNRLKAGRTDPTGPSTGTRLVLRGGSYGNSADYTINGGTILFHASACRDVFDPSKRKKGDVFMKEVGFRVAMNGSKAVVRVFLNGTLVTDAELVHLKGLNNLELLNLNDTTITGVGLVHLKGLTKLKILHLSNTKVSDAGLTHLKGLNNLSQLDVTDTNVTDTGLEHLKGLMNLRKLTLSRGKVTDAGVEKLQQVLPNCTIRHERLRFKGGGGGFF